MISIGARVGALISLTEKSARFLGYGVYEGDFPEMTLSEAEPDLVRELVSEKDIDSADAIFLRLHDPARIKLDSGEIVRGFECYWTDEETVQEYLAKIPFTMCRIVRDEQGKCLQIQDMADDNVGV